MTEGVEVFIWCRKLPVTNQYLIQAACRCWVVRSW